MGNLLVHNNHVFTFNGNVFGYTPPPPVYGVEWEDMSVNSTGVRTGDAAGFADPIPAVAGGTGSSPFDDIMPWSGMVRSLDYDVAGEVVAIPKFYYKWTKTGSKLGLQISMEKLDGFYTSPTHADRGDGKGERDIVYVGRYHSCDIAWSVTGQMPKTNITRAEARAAAHHLGSNVWQFDFATRMTIWMLYLVEFADWNSQKRIGYGCGNGSSIEKVGASDNMKYHTGTMQADRTTYGVGVQYRNIEGLWDNVFDWMDGCCYSTDGMSVIMNPNYFNDKARMGTVIGVPVRGRAPRAFDITTAAGCQWIYPSATGRGFSTGSCDFWDYDNRLPWLLCGGGYPNNEGSGLFCVRLYDLSTSDPSPIPFIGFRVIVLP